MSAVFQSHTAMVEDEEEEDNEEELLPKYAVGQRVFCPEGSELYESVVRKTALKDGEWSYFVHFLGWNARWDKWLPESSILEYTDERRQAVQKQERVKKEQQQRQKQEANERKRKKREDGGGVSGKRRYEGPSWEDFSDLPFTLKTILVDDRERIMRMGFDSPFGYDCNIEPGKWKPARDVHNLPASVTIRTVLNQYVKMKKKGATSPEDAEEVERKTRKFVDGLALLFDDSLPVCLLYNPERPQYLQVKSDPTLKSLRNSEIYGCEFLLRLFVRLPILLEETGPVEAGKRREMGQQIADLIVVLQKNRQGCFKAKYREPKYDELHDWEKSLTDGAAPISMEDY